MKPHELFQAEEIRQGSNLWRISTSSQEWHHCMLVGSDVPSYVLSPAFRPVFRQPTNTTIWANLSNTSSQVSHEQCRHVQHVFTICRADSNLPTWSIFLLMLYTRLLSGSHIYFHSSLCLISLKRLSEIISNEAGGDGIGMVIIGQRCSKSTCSANKDILTNTDTDIFVWGRSSKWPWLHQQ